MRYLLLICLSVIFTLSCKSDKTNTQQTVEKTVGAIDSDLSTEQKSLANNAQTVAIDEKPIELDSKITTDKTTVDSKVEAKKESKIVKKSTPKSTKTATKKANQVKKQVKTKKTSTPPVIKAEKKEVIKNEPKPMAIIKFDNPVLDFGEITEGDIIEHDFFFTNTGNAPLQILEADATCGCTTPEIPFLDIEPGQKNKIHISYNSVNKEGYETPSVTLKTNGAPTYIKLNLFGTVKTNPDKKPIKLENPAKKAEGTVKEPNPVKVKEPNPVKVKEENPDK